MPLLMPTELLVLVHGTRVVAVQEAQQLDLWLVVEAISFLVDWIYGKAFSTGTLLDLMFQFLFWRVVDV
jgi:hypothetical protein